MDFDSVISIFLVFIFFVFPVILKKIQSKKTVAGAGTVKKKASLFERMGEQVQQFVRDLEEQAKAEKGVTKKQEDIWERLAEGETLFIDPIGTKTKTEVEKKWPGIKEQPSGPEKEMPSAKAFFKEKRPVLVKETSACRLPGQYVLNSRQKLRQAIVWSEILSKPVALREK